MAAPAALATVWADRPGVNDILGETNVKLRLDDDQTGALSAAEEAILTRLYSVATAYVRLYLSNYDAAGLANDWNVYYWTCVVVTYRLCKRRANAVTAALADLYRETMQTLELIRSGVMTMADVALVASPSMSISNVRLDGRYHTRQLRVEPTISDPIRARHEQARDWTSVMMPDLPQP